jgi:hypothetical protein
VYGLSKLESLFYLFIRVFEVTRIHVSRALPRTLTAHTIWNGLCLIVLVFLWISSASLRVFLNFAWKNPVPAFALVVALEVTDAPGSLKDIAAGGDCRRSQPATALVGVYVVQLHSMD